MRFRLTMPGRFRSERAALDFIRLNSLFPVGAQCHQVDGIGPGRWRVFIDTGKPDAVQRYLSQSLQAGEWPRSELQ
jgi:hypothetical protein